MRLYSWLPGPKSLNSMFCPTNLNLKVYNKQYDRQTLYIWKLNELIKLSHWQNGCSLEKTSTLTLLISAPAFIKQ